MQKLWVNNYADTAVEALQNAAKFTDWQHPCPENIRVVLERELVAKEPDRWVVCWTGRCIDMLLWKSVHRLGTQNFLLQRLIQTNAKGEQKLLADLPYKKQFQTQIVLLNLDE
jgi:hypothetical protein